MVTASWFTAPRAPLEQQTRRIQGTLPLWRAFKTHDLKKKNSTSSESKASCYRRCVGAVSPIYRGTATDTVPTISPIKNLADINCSKKRNVPRQ